MKTKKESKVSNILSKRNIYINKSQNAKHLDIKKNAEADKHNFTTSKAFEILINLLEPEKHEQKKVTNKNNKEKRKISNLIYEDIKEQNKIQKLNKKVISQSNLESSDSDICENNIDPFYHHYQSPDEEKLNSFVEKAAKNKWIIEKKEIIEIGKLVQYRLSETDNFGIKLKILTPDINNFKIKKSLKESFFKYQSIYHESNTLTNIQNISITPIFLYQDFLFTYLNYNNKKELRSLYTLHILNHIYKTRHYILKNNEKLNHSQNPEIEYRDQGFTRPKILILLPTKNSCLEVVQTIINISKTEQQENKKRFIDEYSIELDNINQSKPADYKDLFIGNTDDIFRLGIKITRKTLKIFSEFYNSDIILASPLGLRLLIDEKGKKKNRDYLSSIEITIIDNANALQMQNWEHVSYIFDNLNVLPNEAHECNFSRVRNWYLDGNSKFLRQTLIFAQYLTPEINSLFINYLFNISGKNKIKQTYKGSIEDVGYKIKQIFLRLHSSDPSIDPDTKFSYFKTSILPNIVRSEGNGFLIFIPSYFDFVRIRNYLNKEEVSFTFISEYSSNSEVSKARSYFNTGNKKILLYTERAHYYRRYNIKGVNTLIFYSLPENSLFYPELIGFMLETQKGKNCNKHSKVLFSKWDALKLERIIGSKRINLMCHGANDIFAFL
ncbi:unnamed protein product [Pneumocystis jirovecii]|uniref:U3 small nucleolar RNA-associated protein 25 n=2 Tax=Pneumocystis jirovecii TaxID=42068 RepID=L0PES3_PNEJI|nr:rRNA-binding ribosome biosynthesis protein UTP25 [Pneumocystis jirovecii RU7]KTW32695.1 hypothetical protein T551_00180 [Pneumocystis jirovecii RU7]CCJ30737.1 unnamed protein product [Pneumocystis jirovecii]